MQQALNFIALTWMALGFSPVWAAPLVAPTPDPKIVLLPEDEIVLPPLFQHIEGGDILNVTSLQNRKRSAKVGEWLEYGDYFSLPARLSFEVILRETIQWVGGGVFQGRIGQRTWREGGTPYEVFLERGWMKVWAKPDDHKNSIKIFTKNVYLKTDHAAFWLTTRPGRTEVYLVEGELEDSVGHVYKEKKFYLWEGEKHQMKFSSKSWDEKAIEVQISSLYPSLVKLADQAGSEWNKGESQRTYAKLRRQGWRKVDRHEPDPAVYPVQKKK
jgi:hypothetical protein